MKRIAVLMVLVVLFSSCVSTGSSTQKVETPRREYMSVNTDGMDYSDMFVINNNYKSTNLIFSDTSKYLSATLFASDLGIFDSVSKEDINKIRNYSFQICLWRMKPKLLLFPNYQNIL